MGPKGSSRGNFFGTQYTQVSKPALSSRGRLPQGYSYHNRERSQPERFQWSKSALAHFLDLTGVCDVEHGSVGGIASKVPAECSVLGHDSVGIALSNSTWLQFIPIVKGHNSEPCKQSRFFFIKKNLLKHSNPKTNFVRKKYLVQLHSVKVQTGDWDNQYRR